MLTIKVIHTTEHSDEVERKLDKVLANQKAISKQINEVGKKILDAIGDPAKIAELTRQLSDGTDRLKEAMDEVSPKQS